MSRKIIVFDTTLRDGEQVPGAKLNVQQKIEIAQQLKKLRVDIIEAGFPASSEGDFRAVQEIARSVGDSVSITALARAVKSDIDAVYESVKIAQDPLIHIVLGTSNIHVEKKFNRSKDAVMEMGVEAVRYAKTLLPHVQYSTEDASRSDFEYLWSTIEAVVKAGATMINVPDTVGYAVPDEFGDLIRRINDRLKNLNPDVILSVHCHNDLGMATANTLAAIKNGAEKVECTINGLGERAGNASLEEVVMGMKVRENFYQCHTNINTKELLRTSMLVSHLTGLDVQVNKAITGANAFAHSSGIHQDGLLKDKQVYEIMSPEEVGADSMELILTARSGRHAFKNAVEKLGFETNDAADFEVLFAKFLELADAKKEVYDHDVFYLVANHRTLADSSKHLYELESFQVVSNDLYPTATVKLKKGEEMLKGSAVGEGPIEALYDVIKTLVGLDVHLKDYKINSISRGKDAVGRVNIRIEYMGKTYSGRAMDTDIIKASALAFLNGVNAAVLDLVAVG
ncbi:MULTISPECIES: 2-isopropylmalate synthase [Brevibacillus]|jgi:2-isopropylmalate synthase|uniref:2-isopropylmalate synthase n=1 Tax=Brevibacillus parabrevis TaxID=54914 RepID=A0A4Y3P8L0_BREPA|nr:MULTISPECIES: 2-isopropylmalate synthase [Brevibacillus]MBU8712861.1 2-isopropylmalate synthase [Brevibacillus parabrevis]MDH6348372.1 2-isopropylmalate synthase [Brevibacillus sp. 1238]MDR5000510.1 2-isopropylmalate synthase [Brevibacillus parabrevis]MED1722005.1 2-isopropylmalate synthase [Brevibacillus parabrevis]MED2256530.1 2-isopropylmalate synthase [Brevibacillus parabrevis]